MEAWKTERTGGKYSIQTSRLLYTEIKTRERAHPNGWAFSFILNDVSDKIHSDQPHQPIDQQKRNGLYELRDYF